VRALISVYDKTGLGSFARGLLELGFELVASGGTASALAAEELPVTPVEEVTAFPEVLAGRVKTLHPRIHAGILARRGVPDDLAQLDEHAIAPFDLVCVNLYPFEVVAEQPGADEEEILEMIDVGGPAMLRAAAKNHPHVVPVCRPEDYDLVLRELGEGDGATSAETRRRLAGIAFARTAAYDAAIARWFEHEDAFPETFVPVFRRDRELAYGENPHQRAAYYGERGGRTHLLSFVEQLGGKPLSFNNLNDLSAARLLARELQHPACVIVKHANPCGVAVADSVDEAYAKALAADPVSAYGGVVVLNRPVSEALGHELAEQFLEVLFAPGFDEAALAAVSRRTGLRILSHEERRAPDETELDYRRVIGGLLVQERDPTVADASGMEVVCGNVSEEQWPDLLFAWRVAKHVTSNAIVLARDGRTIGIGAGQTSRVDAVRIAVEKARELGHAVEGSVLASDAFFPFADGPEIALEAGVAALIQPGGSKRDAEVTDAVRASGAAMVFTHRRHFRH
jgi:phosphoribosylaminoimidazolecarboxamide formyltransferase/IMP cyclohydrolase